VVGREEPLSERFKGKGDSLLNISNVQEAQLAERNGTNLQQQPTTEKHHQI